MLIVPVVFQTEPALRDVGGFDLHADGGSKLGHHHRQIVYLGETVADEQHTDGLPGDDGNGGGGGAGGRKTQTGGFTRRTGGWGCAPPAATHKDGEEKAAEQPEAAVGHAMTITFSARR